MLLRLAASRIRAVDPGAEIVLGGMWSAKDRPEGVIGSVHYLRQLYRVPGIEDSFDAIAVHPYAKRLRDVFRQIDAVRKAGRRAGDGGVGLWVTELGWASDGRRGEGLVKDPDQQARLLERAFNRLRPPPRALSPARRVLVLVAGHPEGGGGLRLVRVLGPDLAPRIGKARLQRDANAIAGARIGQRGRGCGGGNNCRWCAGPRWSLGVRLVG